MKYINRLIVVVLVLTSLFSFASASGSRVARMNYQTGQTLTGNGIDALESTAKRQPGLRMFLDNSLDPSWPGNCEIVQHWTVPAGTDFVNSGLDRRGVPCQWRQKATESFVAVQVRNKISNKVVVIKNNCLNPVNRVPAAPMINRELTETSSSSEVDVDVNLEVGIDFKPTVVATATASTSPIYNIINITTPGAPLMMGGGGNPNQYVVFRDARGFLSLGTTLGGKAPSICITNNNVNVNDNTNTNTNNNSNSNSNSNSNNINIGGGEPAPEPLLACSDIGAYVDGLFQLDAHRPREAIAA
jgi:hypothetical protein